MRPLAFWMSAGALLLGAMGCGSSSKNTFGTGGSTSGSGGGASSATVGPGSGGGFVSSASSAQASSGSASGTSSASSAESSASASSSGAGGGAPQSGDCQSDADCPGGRCIELTPGGFRACKVPPVEATSCMSQPPDQCCDSADCESGFACYLAPIVPTCGGPQQIPYNQCAVDQCKSDAECPSAHFCAPSGTLDLKVNACKPAGCKVDADCADAPDGYCAPIESPCCGDVTAGLFCVYPGSGGCRKTADCPANSHCQVDLGGKKAVCNSGPLVCPQ